MELASIGLVALAIAGLLTIPFVANSVSSYAISNYDEGLAPVFNETPGNFSSTDASHYPGTSEDALGPSEYRKTAETAFGRFSISVSPGMLEMSLQRPGSRTDITESSDPAIATWKMKTSEYEYEVRKSPDNVTETISIPSGTCVKTLKQGSASEKCTGRISDIDNMWEDAKSRLNHEADLMKQAADSIDVINLNSVQWKYS